MSIATGIWRQGRIELQTPPPSDWSDGDEVTIVHSNDPAAADILGEGPEAAAAWLAYLEELDKSTGNSNFPALVQAVPTSKARTALTESASTSDCFPL